MFLQLDECVNLFCLYLQFPCGQVVFYKMCGRMSSYWEEHVINIKNLKTEMQLATKSSNTKSDGSADATSASTTVQV
eukprot:UN09575